MKKIVLFTIISFCLFTDLHAQKLRFGIQGSGGVGTALTTDREKELSEIETVYLGISKIYPVFSYGINAYAGYSINENWGIAIEPGIFRKGFAKKVEVNNKIVRQQTHLNYFQLPILAELFLDKNITLTVGPELSYLFSAKEMTEKQSTDVFEQYRKNKLDIALQIGLYYTFNNHFDIGLKSGVSAIRLERFSILNDKNEVVTEYDRRNAYGHAFFRIKL